MKFWHCLCLVPVFLAPTAQAEIYKCVADDGSVSYSQIPCPERKSEAVPLTSSRNDAPIDCRWASQFANDVARRMRSGQSSDAIFDLYGGVDSVSKGTNNIINYVYRFRSDESIAVERIASLAGNMCKSGSLGDVRCESLPYGEDPSGKRCDPDAEEPANVPRIATAATAATTRNERSVSSISGRSAADQESCRDSYRDQIDAIDAQMRQGYDSAEGERYRERLRSLTSRMREC